MPPVDADRESSKGYIRSFIDDLAGEYTILFVEHNMDIVMNISDTVLVLQNGAIIASGPPSEVQGDESVQKAYLGGIA